MRGPGWLCRLTPHGNRFSQRKGEGQPVPLSIAEERSFAYSVIEAEIEESARRVHLLRTEETEVAPASTLEALTDGFSRDSRVRYLVVDAEHRRLTADFDRMMIASEPD